MKTFNRGQTQRLHTSLSLYSNELQGIVLFTDCQKPSNSASFAAFQHVCQNGTELHFLPVEHQLETLASQARQEAVEWRLQNNDVSCKFNVVVGKKIIKFL